MQARQSAGQTRTEAQNQLTLDFIEHVSPEIFSVDSVKYIKADEDYHASLAAHPIPRPPRLVC